MKTFPETPEEIERLMRLMHYFLVGAPIFWLFFLYIYFVSAYSEAMSPGFLILFPIFYILLLRRYLKFKNLE
ncbi:hypothetical protein SAMN04489723_11489 [Algoriphagus aquimarinus]|uniref:Uncharacterized protein n=1 Tax=Algoriphagus aquimarinus TaxID=237018 RepID=A0A1I1BLD8_9BACT|nr:hypothetical protein SAMN04489723_11489 [Algoriphagus aquimarinus]